MLCLKRTHVTDQELIRLLSFLGPLVTQLQGLLPVPAGSSILDRMYPTLTARAFRHCVLGAEEMEVSLQLLIHELRWWDRDPSSCEGNGDEDKIGKNSVVREISPKEVTIAGVVNQAQIRHRD